jgi:chitin synthase
MITQIKREKYILIFLLLCINACLSTLTIIYPSKWYIFLIILALSSTINTINVMLILGYKIKKYLENNTVVNTNQTIRTNIDNGNITATSGTVIISKQYRIIYIVPCYNETLEEIDRTIKSIFEQKNTYGYSRQLIVICDGKIPRKNENQLRLDEILVNNIFKDHILEKHIFVNAYKTWDNKFNNIELYSGKINNELDFILMVKPINYGKRDSLALIRNLLYYYNKYVINFNKTISLQSSNIDQNKVQSIKKDLENVGIDLYFMTTIIDYLNLSCLKLSKYELTSNLNQIDFLIGTDADTVLDTNCTIELINAISIAEDTCIGVVGYVDIDLGYDKFNPLVMYQYAEYTFAQYLKRFMQSKITHKVNCLSGCVQLLKICDETCGIELMQAFNRLPSKDENIFNQIRSYASEDRNHLSHMFSLTPYVSAIQAEKALAYTHVPMKFKHFFRQRKRWTAGATSNDMLLVMNSKHNLWERINSAANIIIYAVSPFVLVATIEFIIAIIYSPSFLMLYLSIIMIVPFLYSLSIPLIKYKTLSHNNESILSSNPANAVNTANALYYYICMMMYIIFGSILNLCVYVYTFWHLDDLNWNMIKLNNNEDGRQIGLSDSISGMSISDNIVKNNECDVIAINETDMDIVFDGVKNAGMKNIYQVSDETLFTKVENNTNAITQEELNIIVNQDVPHLLNGVRPRITLSRRFTSNIVSRISSGTRYLYNGFINLFKTNTEHNENESNDLDRQNNTNNTNNTNNKEKEDNISNTIDNNKTDDADDADDVDDADDGMNENVEINTEMLLELNDLQYENDKFENQQIQYTSRSDKTTSNNFNLIDNTASNGIASNRNTVLRISNDVDNIIGIADDCINFMSDDDNFVDLEDGFKLYDSTKA